jgi:hypothetical protein
LNHCRDSLTRLQLTRSRSHTIHEIEGQLDGGRGHLVLVCINIPANATRRLSSRHRSFDPLDVLWLCTLIQAA